MVKRNCTIDYEFVCVTDNRRGLSKDIKVVELPDLGLHGWWYKLWLFSKDLPLKGTLLFMDLDVVVFDNIDKLFDYKPNDSLLIIRDFNRFMKPNYQRVNSSIMRFKSGVHHKAYQKFMKNNKDWMRNRLGDQDFIYRQMNDFTMWPDEWIRSYKWEMRGRPAMVQDPTGGRNFATTGEPKITADSCIAVFHGDPNPHKCKDQWVIDNWR